MKNGKEPDVPDAQTGKSKKLSKEEIRRLMSGETKQETRNQFERDRDAIRQKEVEAANRRDEEQLLRRAEAREEARQTSQDEQDTQTRRDNTQSDDEETVVASSETDNEAAESRTEPKEDGGQGSSNDRFALLEKELKLRDLRMERLEFENQKWKTRAQRRAGELDYIKNQGGRANEAGEATDSVLDNFFDETEPQTLRRQESSESSNPLSRRLSALEAEAVEAAKERAVARFSADFADFEQDSEFTTVIKELGAEYADDLSSGNPKLVEKATNTLLRDARLEVLTRREETALQAARKKQATVAQRVRQQKLDGEISDGSDAGTEDNNPSKRTYGSLKEQLMDMDMDDLADLLTAQAKRAQRRSS